MDPEQVARHAGGIQRAHDLLGEHMAPSSRFQSKIKAAAAKAGVGVQTVRTLDGMAMRWSAIVTTARGSAQFFLLFEEADFEGLSNEVFEKRVDLSWEAAFRELGLFD
jgi:hypothetical protein